MPLAEAEEGLDRDGEDEIRAEEGAEEEDKQLACMKTCKEIWRCPNTQSIRFGTRNNGYNGIWTMLLLSPCITILCRLIAALSLYDSHLHMYITVLPLF